MSASQMARRRGQQVVLAVLGNVIPIAIACVAGWSSHHAVFFIGAVGACAVPLMVTGLPASWTRTRSVSALSGLVGLTMMQAYSGGAASGYTVLIVMPMIWFGLQARDRDLLAMVAVLIGCAYLPMIVFGAPAYPVHWANATLVVLVGVTVAGALRLVSRETLSVTERLRADAITDPLTGLLNRRGWQPAATAALGHAGRHQRSVSAAVFDLDAFKELNDRFGHDKGDTVLQQTAHALRSALRAGDIVARSGGDEFIALLIDTAPEGAAIAIQRLITEHQRLSAGIAGWDFHEPLDELVRRADLALYEAKRAGGRRVVTAPTSLEEDRLTTA